MYTVPDNGHTETYVMQGTDLHQHLLSPALENIETMTNDGATEFVVDPSLYYPAATSYGYYCTGFESPGEWDDRHAIFGLDGADIQYAGAQTENMPYVYYTPGYGYGDSPFNPYNPYIPGAVVGVDGSYVGTQPYYSVSSYQNSVSSHGYYPVVYQPGPDIAASSSTDTLSDVRPAVTHRASASSAKRIQSSAPSTFPVNPSKGASSQAPAFTGASQGLKANAVASKRPMSNRTNGSGSLHGSSSHLSQSGNASMSLQSNGKISYGKLQPQANQLKLSFPAGGGLSDYASGTNSQVIVNDTWPTYYYRRASTDVNGYIDPLGEQNRGPRISKSKNEFVVKAYSTRAGQCNSDGNIVISADQYNKDDFVVDYVNAKFFVIKSYSEDDVHKSVKYNVWSSTPNGNKKLNSTYEDAQKIAAGRPGGCPIFLFFSVNASGQFCGVAEMVGPVDFDKDMDFWHQDKWSGSFPVKWHFIKDVPNPSFRHIVLANNEHKPVTNSRDTQEIMHKPGTEMLKIFKNYSAKTSLLDDFLYYENRQRIMYDERARFLRKHPHSQEPPVKLNHVVDRSRKEDDIGTWVEKFAPSSNASASKAAESLPEKVFSGNDIGGSDLTSTKQKTSDEKSVDVVSTLKVGSLCINPKQSESHTTVTAAASVSSAAQKTATAPSNVVTVGSMPITVDGAKRSLAVVTVGSIQLDPKTLQDGKVGGYAKGGPQK